MRPAACVLPSGGETRKDGTKNKRRKCETSPSLIYRALLTSWWLQGHSQEYVNRTKNAQRSPGRKAAVPRCSQIFAPKLFVSCSPGSPALLLLPTELAKPSAPCRIRPCQKTTARAGLGGIRCLPRLIQGPLGPQGLDAQALRTPLHLLLPQEAPRAPAEPPLASFSPFWRRGGAVLPCPRRSRRRH